MGKQYRGVLEVAERSMVKWHECEAMPNRQCRASVVGGVQENGARKGNITSTRKPYEGNGGRGRLQEALKRNHGGIK